MTQQAFDAYPFLMTPAQVREATGLTDHDIQALSQQGKLTQFRRRPNGYAKYYKSEVACLLKLKC